MTERLQIYKCGICGNMVEVVHAAAGTLVCCGQNMILLKEGTTDAAVEKHVPVIEKVGESFKVKVGEVAHPMEEKHHVEFIELIVDGKVCRTYLNPGEPPEAAFDIKAENAVAREYCNLHGLWKT